MSNKYTSNKIYLEVKIIIMIRITLDKALNNAGITRYELAKRTDISPFVRMAMIFQACRNSSAAFLKIHSDAGNGVQENAFLHNNVSRVSTLKKWTK